MWGGLGGGSGSAALRAFTPSTVFSARPAVAAGDRAARPISTSRK